VLDQLIERGSHALDRGELAAALLDFRKVLEERPHFADVRNRAGLCLALLGDLEAALKEFGEALTVNPTYREAEVHRAIVLNELGRYEEARAGFARVRQLDANDERTLPGSVGDRIANAHAELADLYREAGDHTKAGEEYRRALAIRPTFLDIRTRLGRTYMALSDLPAAREELEAILARNPHLTGARLQLGLVLRRMGETEAAVREWVRCATEDPDDLRGRAYLASVGVAGAEIGT
jgi:tetratricopeptide (TPR) repeat protein